MAHVGVERLGACDREKYGSQRDERRPLMIGEHGQAVDRIEGPEHVRRLDDLHQAEQAENEEPQAHHRPEEQPYVSGATALHDEQRDQDDQRERHHVGLEQRRRHLQALDRAQDRDRGRDHAVAVEQGCANHGQHQHGALPARRQGALRQRGKRQDASFAAVVGAQDDDHVFQRHDREQRPGDQGQHAEYGRFAERQIPSLAECLAHRVERARADIAVDDANRRDRQRGQTALRRSGGRSAARSRGRPRSVHERRLGTPIAPTARRARTR
jgi:hypothetical protein